MNIFAYISELIQINDERHLEINRISIVRLATNMKGYRALKKGNFQKSLKLVRWGLFQCTNSVEKVSTLIQVDQDRYFGGKGVFLVKLAPKTDLKEVEFPKIIETRWEGSVLIHTTS